MNKKVLQTILVFVVLGVWGLVIYRMVSKPTAEIDTGVGISMSHNTSATQTTYGDSALILNYADPFLRNIARPQAEIKLDHQTHKSAKRSTPKEEKLAPVAEVWPEIRYKGIIENKSSGKQLAIISVDGAEKIVKVGDVIDGLLVNAVSKSTISLKSSSNNIRTFNSESK